MRFIVLFIVFLLLVVPVRAQEPAPILPASSATQLDVLTILQHPSPVLEAYFSTAGRYFISGSLDGVWHIWQVAAHSTRTRGEQLYTLDHYTPGSSLLVTDAQDDYFAVTSASGSIEIRELETGEIHARFDEHTTPISNLYFLNSQQMLSKDYTDTVFVWDRESGEQLAIHENIVSQKIHANFYALLNETGDIQIYFDHPNEFLLHANADDFSLSPDGVLVAAWGQSITLWQSETGEKLFELTDIPVDNIVWTPDSQHFVIQEFDGAEIWSIERKQTDIFTRFGNGVETLVIAPDGESIVTLDRDNRPRVWRLQDGQVAQIGSLPALVDRIEISPDSETLVGFEVGYETNFWWTDTGFKGGETRLIPDNAIFSSDWQFLASYTNNLVVWYGLPMDELRFETQPIGNPKRRSYVYPVPSEESPFIIGLDADRRLFALARTYDSEWVQIIIEDATSGWVKTDTLTLQGDLSDLPIVRTGKIEILEDEVLLATENNGNPTLMGCQPQQTVIILMQQGQHYQIDCGDVVGWLPSHQVIVDR